MTILITYLSGLIIFSIGSFISEGYWALKDETYSEQTDREILQIAVPPLWPLMLPGILLWKVGRLIGDKAGTAIHNYQNRPKEVELPKVISWCSYCLRDEVCTNCGYPARKTPNR